MKLWSTSMLLLAVIAVVKGNSPDACKTVGQILTSHNYQYETHRVVTADGYFLTLFRVIGKTGQPRAEHQNRPPLVLQHGISASANNFVGNGENSPAMYFFNRGFDVWLPSVRGTQYSKGHLTWGEESEQYWNFTFEELGTYDTKAYIEYIYRKTGQKVLYLGFSQGFMQIMAAFSLDPEFFQHYVAKIMGWAPAVRMDLTTNVGIILGGYVGGLIGVAPWLGITHLLDFNYDSCMSQVQLCDTSSLFCKLRLMMSGDFLPLYDSEYGQTYGQEATSVKDFAHFVYNVAQQGFYRYPENGRKEPYDMTKIKGVPIGLCIGKADMLASVANGQWLESVFRANGNPAVAKYYDYLGHQTFLISRHNFTHMEDTAKFFEQPILPPSIV